MDRPNNMLFNPIGSLIKIESLTTSLRLEQCSKNVCGITILMHSEQVAFMVYLEAICMSCLYNIDKDGSFY